MSGIFISYRRRGVGAGYVGRLADRLADHFGDDSVFRDIDDIEPGRNFADAIREAVGSCDALIAVIDPNWLTVVDDDGHPRLEDPQDFVRLEIEAALERQTTVIPVLIDTATMPRRNQLPESLGELSMRQAVTLGESSTDFKAHVARLIGALERIGVRPVQAEAPPSAQPQPQPQPEPEPQPRPEPLSGPAPPAQAAPASLQEVLVGTWNVTIQMPNGYMAQCTLSLMPNLTFEGQLMNPMGQFAVRGQWAVAPSLQLTFQGAAYPNGWPGPPQPWYVAQSFNEVAPNRLAGWTVAGEAVVWTRVA
jgi:TIR domain-containing protein